MNNLTKKQRKQFKKVNKFIESTPLPNLVHKVLMKLGERDEYVYPSKEHQLLDGWEDLKLYAHDVVNYGASGGSYGNFIYHADTTPFVENNRRDIKELLEVYYDDMDNAYKSMESWTAMAELGASCFEIQGVFQYADKEIVVYNQILQHIAHYVVEEISTLYVDHKESN